MTSVAPRRSGHLVELDVLRILTFGCVIAVHVTSATLQSGDEGMSVVLGLVHFTREVFFALTAFVLVYSFRRRPQPMRRFWPRRFLLVGVPYLAWSLIYVVEADIASPPASPLAAVRRLLLAILLGSANYHLYFLLVTMQVYLLVPLILLLVRATRGHHVAVLVAAFVVQVLLLGVWQYFPQVAAGLGPVPSETFPSYLFMIVAGAIAADSADGFLLWIRTGRRTIGVVAAVAGALTVAVFLLQQLLGLSTSRAVTALQPIEVVWASAVGLGFLALGAAWADRRREGGPLDRAVARACDLSFGIFLVHPLLIDLLQDVGGRAVLAALSDPWRQLLLYVAVVVCAVGTTTLLRRTPLSLPLTGRRMQRGTAGRTAVQPRADAA